MNGESGSVELTTLSEVFGAHKAEWLGARLFELFAEPAYFPRMTTPRPCVLVGGRGTGKTTVLRGLSYEGRYAIRKSDAAGIADWPYYGIYYRVDTNRVSAFQGPELSETEWIRRFGHYVNLLLCGQLMRFLLWFEKNTAVSTELDLAARKLVASSLQIPLPNDNAGLLESLQLAMASFEAHINNVAAAGSGPTLSMQGAPIQSLLEAIVRQPVFRGKLFFFLIDEYENLLGYQQRIMNTLIKHAGELCTFKIGVRELGWRPRTTLNENEQLISPADYIRIDISNELQGSLFEELAMRVCQDRLAVVRRSRSSPSPGIREMLPGLSENEEASLLGIDAAVAQTIDKLKTIDKQGIAGDLKPMTVCLLDYWSKSHNQSLDAVFQDFLERPSEWDNRANNYAHALLFTLQRGKRGIRKYYAGWDTFILLSGGNIRYLLQLVEESLTSHLREGKSLNEPVSQKTQTIASQRVGRTNLTELEGLAAGGAKLTKLLLGLGRVFGVMAASPEGHTPEVNQFEVVDTPDQPAKSQEVDDLLTAAVMHLALLRSSGSKPADVGDTRDWDYMVHPIYAPFFNFSYRRKRKLQLSGRQLLDLVSRPRKAIKEILAASDRTPDDPLPEQLRLFEMYYAETN